MATGTFTYNSLPTKTLKERKNTEKNCKPFKLYKRNAVSVKRLSLNHIFPCAQWAKFGSQHIVVKSTATTFFLSVDANNRQHGESYIKNIDITNTDLTSEYSPLSNLNVILPKTLNWTYQAPLATVLE